MVQFLCVFESVAPINTGKNPQTHLCLALQKSKPFRNVRCSTRYSLSVPDDLIIINSPGLLPSQISDKSSGRADSVLELFEKSGFSQTQIKTVVSKCPRILKCDAEKTLKPKIDFFRSILTSDEDVANTITKSPFTLFRSLKGYLTPSFDLLTTVLGGEQNAVYAIKRFPFVFQYNFLKNLESNLSTLRDFGVPESQISIMMFTLGTGKVIGYTPIDWFSQTVDAVTKMGFDPCSSSFANAVSAMAMHKNESNWKSKLEFYRSFGFSNEEVVSMFRKQPISMQLSEEKIRGVVEFYISKFHWSTSQLSARPNVLLYSLEKRIIPRCSVLQLLVSRGKSPKLLSVNTVLTLTEEYFVGRFVNSYMDQLPEVLDAYEGKLTFEEYNFDFGETRG